MKRAKVLGWSLSIISLIAFTIGLCGLLASIANENMKRHAYIAYQVGATCRCDGIPYEFNPYNLKFQVDCWNKGWKEAKCPE